ncbi:hypothetical protein NUSPORA_01169 [Nucleospora cyclopteri]
MLLGFYMYYEHFFIIILIILHTCKGAFPYKTLKEEDEITEILKDKSPCEKEEILESVLETVRKHKDYKDCPKLYIKDYDLKDNPFINKYQEPARIERPKIVQGYNKDNLPDKDRLKKDYFTQKPPQNIPMVKYVDNMQVSPINNGFQRPIQRPLNYSHPTEPKIDRIEQFIERKQQIVRPYLSQPTEYNRENYRPLRKHRYIKKPTSRRSHKRYRLKEPYSTQSTDYEVEDEKIEISHRIKEPSTAESPDYEIKPRYVKTRHSRPQNNQQVANIMELINRFTDINGQRKLKSGSKQKKNHSKRRTEEVIEENPKTRKTEVKMENIYEIKNLKDGKEKDLTKGYTESEEKEDSSIERYAGLDDEAEDFSKYILKTNGLLHDSSQVDTFLGKLRESLKKKDV